MTAELRRYAAYFRPHTAMLVVSTALMAISAVLPGLAVALLAQVLDQVGRGTVKTSWIAVFVGVYLLQSLLNIVRTAITKRIGWQVASDVRQRLFAAYLRGGPGSTGERLAALTQDVDELPYGVSALVTAFRNPLTLIVLAITAISLAPGLTPWALGLGIAVLVPTRLGGRWLRGLSERFRDMRRRMIRSAQDQLVGATTARSFGATDAEVSRFIEFDRSDRDARIELDIARTVPSAVTETAAALAVGLLLWLGGRQVAAGTLTPSGLVGFAVALGLMSRPLAGLSEVWALLQRSLVAVDAIEAALSFPPALPVADPPASLPPGPLDMAVHDVRVDFGDGPVLAGVTLTLAAGRRMLIVGPTGAGKSTLLRLLCRGLDPDSGSVRIGGVEVRAVSPFELARHVAVVPQDGFLFARSIGENLRLGRPDATDVQLDRAVADAGIAELVAELGYSRQVSELGRDLSGGERQRLCLARAFVADTPVLLLDEATNQIDAPTAAAVLQRLIDARPEATVVLVAHDLSAARWADHVVVLEQGQVVAQGPHNELIRGGGWYAAAWAAQGRP